MIFYDSRSKLSTCRAGAANTEPDTDHSVPTKEETSGSHHYLRSGESLQFSLAGRAVLMFFNKGETTDGEAREASTR